MYKRQKQAHIRDAVAMVRFQIELEKRLEAGEELTELTVDAVSYTHLDVYKRQPCTSCGR